MQLKQKNAIALLITLLFIIAITASIGIGLKQVNKASKEIEKEKFMIQANVTIEDVLKILQNSPELDMIVEEKSAISLFTFLSQTSFLPFESSGAQIILEINSARSKFNPNLILESNSTINEPINQSLREYLSNNNINLALVDIMIDVMGGIKEDLVYNSDIFYEKPELYRDRLASREHFREIQDFYESSYHENSLKNINFNNLFLYSNTKDMKIDLNYATAEVWELILGIDKLRAQEILQGAIPYEKLEDLGLQDDEKEKLNRFKTSFFEPYLDIKIEVIQDDKIAKIRFEYDLVNKKGTNFSYDI